MRASAAAIPAVCRRLLYRPAHWEVRDSVDAALVRVTHWLTTVCFLALLVSGLEIVARHHSRRSIISKTQWPNRS